MARRPGRSRGRACDCAGWGAWRWLPRRRPVPERVRPDARRSPHGRRLPCVRRAQVPANEGEAMTDRISDDVLDGVVVWARAPWRSKPGKARNLECVSNFLRRRFCCLSCSVSSQHASPPPTVAASRKRAARFMAPRCAACGTRRERVVHHLDENPMNNDPVNLQTLCGNCHSFWHAALRRTSTPKGKPMPRLIAWDDCAGSGTASSRRLPPRSSER